MAAKYRSMYERLVANTRLADPGNPQSCWLWTRAAWRGYPTLTIRVPGVKTPRTVAAHRKMLECVHGVEFPFDDAGHLCSESLCVHPDHLEPQAPAFNSAQRWGALAREGDGRMIPALFPLRDALAEAADRAWDSGGVASDFCPF